MRALRYTAGCTRSARRDEAAAGAIVAAAPPFLHPVGETPFLVLKGPPLAQRLYGDPFVREAADIDLLIAPESVLAA